MSISDVSLPAGKAGCETNDPRYKSSTKRPSWAEITTERKRFMVIFDMLRDLKGDPEDGFDIPKSMSRIAQYRYSKTSSLVHYTYIEDINYTVARRY